MKLQVFEKEKVIIYNGSCNVRYLFECIQTLRPNDWFDFSLVADTVIEPVNNLSPMFYRPTILPNFPKTNDTDFYTVCY